MATEEVETRGKGGVLPRHGRKAFGEAQHVRPDPARLCPQKRPRNGSAHVGFRGQPEVQQLQRRGEERRTAPLLRANGVGCLQPIQERPNSAVTVVSGSLLSAVCVPTIRGESGRHHV